jgi:hypothetical protein
MGAFEFLLAFTFLAAGILASVGYAVITVTPADFKLARALFLIAGALVFTDGIMWGVLTDSPLWTRILIVGLIGAVSAVATNEAIRWINNREKIAEPPPAQTTAGPQQDVDFSLYFNCRTAIIPTDSLSNNVLTILEITTAFGDAMIAEHTIPAGRQYIQWPPDYFNAIVFRCELTNYGEKTVFDVELPLRLSVREVVRDTKEPGRISEGITTPSRDYIFKVAKIDSGSDRSTVFYVANRSPNFALVIPNETATLQQLGTASRKTVPVMYSKKPGDIISFVPFPPIK